MKNFIEVEGTLININSISYVRRYIGGCYHSRICFIGHSNADYCRDSYLTVEEVKSLIEEAQNPKRRKK